MGLKENIERIQSLSHQAELAGGEERLKRQREGSRLTARERIDFLLSTNRLNVAVSRARALAVLVGSPALLRAPCHTTRQLTLVNALCRFVEDADEVR